MITLIRYEGLPGGANRLHMVEDRSVMVTMEVDIARIKNEVHIFTDRSKYVLEAVGEMAK